MLTITKNFVHQSRACNGQAGDCHIHAAANATLVPALILKELHRDGFSLPSSACFLYFGMEITNSAGYFAQKHQRNDMETKN